MNRSETKPLHVSIAMVLATACTTAALEAAPMFSWIPSSILMAVPLSQSRSARVNAALDNALQSATSVRSELESLFDRLAEAQSIQDFDVLLPGAEGFTASLSELLRGAKAIPVRAGIDAVKLNQLVRLLAAARSLSSGIDNMRRQFDSPAKTYISNIDPVGMAALARHGWQLSSGAA